MKLLAHLASAYSSTYPYNSPYSTQSSSLPANDWLVIGLISLPFALLILVSMWKIYQKAGRRGWASIVPIYNEWVLFEIVDFPGWWALLSIVPLVSIFPAFMALVSNFRLAKRFGKSAWFGVLLIFLPFIGFPILAFGKSTFQGPTNHDDSANADGGNAPVVPGQPFAPAAPIAPEADVATQAPVAPQAPVYTPAEQPAGPATQFTPAPQPEEAPVQHPVEAVQPAQPTYGSDNTNPPTPTVG